MRKILKKIKNVIGNKIREYREKREYRRIAKRTQELKRGQSSDVERWKKSKELLENWNERSHILANMVPENARVIEFGAGNMALKKYLPKNCKYQGSDLVQRSPEMKVCDLNMGIYFSLTPYNTAVFSGVLEYVYDIDKVFVQLSEKINTVILSYACSDISSANRLKSGWLSDYTKEDLESIFNRNGYEIMEYTEWKKQSIYKLNQIQDVYNR